MVYSKILKQAYEITKVNKFLWIFGLFLIVENIYLAISQLVDLPKELETYPFLVLFALGLLLFILFFRSKAAVIIAVKAIVEKQETSPGKSFSVARVFLYRILSIAVLIEVGLALLVLIVGTPIQYMFEHGYAYRAIILLVPGLIIVIPVAAVAAFMGILSPLFVVVYDLTIKEAINRSFEMVNKQWVVLTGFALLLFIIGGSALFLAVFVIGLLSEVGIIAVILGSAFFLCLQSAIAVFQQTAWVLAFLELVKPQKLEEAESVIAPEIVS